MNLKLNRPAASSMQTTSARPSFPLQQQPGSLFLGWGPKL